MGCGSTVVKYILFIANVIFALAGLCLAGMGAAVLVSLHQDGFQGLDADAVPIAAIVVGAVAFVIAFFGCCGAIMESKGMLVVYSVLLIILMNLKTALATVLFVATESLVKAVKSEFQELFNKNSPAFNDIESSFGCCGTAGAASYLTSPRPLPATCCDEGLCTMTNSNPGCLGVTDELVRGCSVGVAVLCLALVAIELLLVIFGLCLANHVGNKYKGRY